MKFGKVKKITCSLLVATTLYTGVFTGTALADQKIGTKTYKENGITYQCDSYAYKVIIRRDGSKQTITKNIVYRVGSDGSLEYIRNKSVGTSKCELLPYYYNSDTPMTINEVIYAYVIGEDGAPEKVLVDIRDKCWTVKGKLKFSIVDPGTYYKGKDSSQTKPSSSTNTKKSSSNTSKQTTSSKKPSSTQHSNPTAEVAEKLGLQASILQRESSPEPISIELKMPSSSNILVCAINVTNSTQRPGEDEWYEFQPTVNLNRQGTYYIHYGIQDKNYKMHYGYFGPYVIGARVEEPSTVQTSPQSNEQSLGGTVQKQDKSKLGFREMITVITIMLIIIIIIIIKRLF